MGITEYQWSKDELDRIKLVDAEFDEGQVEENKINRMINMKKIPKKTPIYRIFKAEYLYKMIVNKENTLAHISQWDDPFEGFLFKQKAWDCRRNDWVYFKELLKDYYGQCWSLEKKETDTKWRMYSPEKHGILVKSTVSKLWDNFYDNPNFYHGGKPHSHLTCAIGKVEYLKDKKIKKEFESIPIRERFNDQGSEAIKTLLIKRMEFEHEEEIRIIFNDNEKLNLGGRETMSYSIDDPHKIFCSELIADPRMPDFCFNSYKKLLKAEGFDLEKSKIYDVPELDLIY